MHAEGAIALIDGRRDRIALEVRPATGRGQDPSASPLTRFVERLPIALRTTAELLLERLANHVRRPLGRGSWCVELCPAYLETAGAAHSTAARAWRELRSLVGWVELPIGDARRLLGSLRKRRAGGRWGRHLVLTDEVLGLIRRSLEELGIRDRRAEGLEVEARPTGRGDAWARCPWHDDDEPSLHLLGSGALWCFGCRSRGRWTPLVDGRAVATRSATDAEDPADGRNRREVGPRLVLSAPESDDDRRAIPSTSTATDRSADGRVTIWRVGSRTRITRSRSTDLLEVVQRADRGAEGRLARGEPLVDAYAATGPTKPVGWREFEIDGRAVFVPTSFELLGVRWLSVDLDGDEGPLLAGGAWAERIGRAALASIPASFLTGRAFVVRTSEGGIHAAVELVDPLALEEVAVEAAPLRRAVETAARLEGFSSAADLAYAGRTVRLPGGRITKSGGLFLAHLAWSVG